MTESFAHYTLLEPLGAGALGPLQRARDRQTGRTVALRFISDAFDGEARQTVVRALQQAAQLSHPNLAAVYETGEHDGRVYYAQEFVPGQPLSAFSEGTPLNARRAVAVGVEIADALAEAAAVGLHHGRLVATQVMITPKGRAKLLDVGFATLAPGEFQDVGPDMPALGRLLETLIVGGGRHVVLPTEVAPVLARAQSGGYDTPALLAADLRAVAETLESKGRLPSPVVPSDSSGGSVLWWVVGIVVLLVAAALIWFAQRS